MTKLFSLTASAMVLRATALSAVMLTGCSTLDLKPQKTVVAADVPAAPISQTGALQWSEAAPEDLPRTDWIAGFNDNQLTALVDQALSQNTDIRVSEARYRAALARLGITQADLLPSVTAGGGVGRTESGNDLIGGSSSISARVDASWEYDLWGRIRDGVDAAELDVAASDADYAGARLAIAARVTQTWFDLIEARLLTELSEREVETQERALRLTTRRFEGGVTGSSDVRLARSSLANAQALQSSRRQRLSALSRSLEVLLREYPDESLTAAADLPPLPLLSGAGTPAFVLRHRPDLLAAERRMRAAGLNVDVARKALLPSLTLSGNITDNASALNNIFDIDSLVASLTAGLTAPIFQGGRIKANIEQQDQILRQQLEGYTGAVLTAYLEVENALDAEDRLEEREVALRTSLEEAVEAERRLELRYTEGLASILQLLDSQSRRLSAESQLISARKERLSNRVRLHVALGGGDITNNGNLSPQLAENEVNFASLQP
ncbi:efflux transporter outer membrane subunit [Fretibacter rubidus]|uniref:efflux transporter outer membrane subunit n=1 Tax=Fretibacter rubidus TaxID=570162 RepID=UPI00352B00DA